jgi:WD40 repeat protein
VAANLIATLIHPERTASVWEVAFSPDGTRLFGAGYPSGIVQIWDVASHKDIRQINTPPGLRSTASYAVLTPDWKTLYVPIDKRKVTPFERGGKTLYRINNSGTIRVWDVESGKEKEPLLPTPGSAPVYANLDPTGRFLTCVERPSYDSNETLPKDVTVLWNLATGKKRKLCEGFAIPIFAPDGKTVVISSSDFTAKTSTIKLIELATGKELATVNCPEKERYFYVGAVSPDGAVVVVSVRGWKKGLPFEKWFLDAKTLELRGKLTGKATPELYGTAVGRFSPDGKRYFVFDADGNVLIWNVANRKLERTLPTGMAVATQEMIISPDGKTMAVAWLPKVDDELKSVRGPDPQDLPQPRVALIDLAGKAKTRVLIAPHGYVGALAISPDGKTLAFSGSGAVHLFDLTKSPSPH